MTTTSESEIPTSCSTGKTRMDGFRWAGKRPGISNWLSTTYRTRPSFSYCISARTRKSNIYGRPGRETDLVVIPENDRPANRIRSAGKKHFTFHARIRAGRNRWKMPKGSLSGNVSYNQDGSLAQTGKSFFHRLYPATSVVDCNTQTTKYKIFTK